MFPLKALLIATLTACEVNSLPGILTDVLKLNPVTTLLQPEPLTILTKLYNKVEKDPFINNNKVLEEYDFVVVGSGPAGCVVTNRLTENPQWKVLLVEAGSDGNLLTDVPALATYFLRTEYDWNFKTERSANACLGLKDNICPWPAGKAVGGSSIINNMVYTRGTKRDYDRWAALGIEGWSYDEVLPYFLKSEDIKIPELVNSPYHSNQGNLTVSYAPYATKVNRVFLEAGSELNIPYVDYNGKDPIGISKYQLNQRDGRRVSAAKAFLYPITSRSNFHISQNSRVTKILIDPATKRAYGVEFMKGDKLQRVLARKEVILSAGAIMSPFLLMHSGVGPQEHLTELEIPVIQDLRVGNNVQEHLNMGGLTFLINDSSLSVDILKDLLPTLPIHFLEWVTHGTGILTDVGCDSLAYLKTPLADSEEYPDVELAFLGFSGFASDGGTNLRKGMGVSDEIYNKVYKPIEGKPGFSIWPMPSLLRSRGFIRLYNNDPLNQPKITHNFLTEQYDVDVMVEAIKMIIRISQTQAFQRIGSRLHDIPIPGCENYQFGSDSYWGCTVRHLTNQWHHFCGSCKMGPDTDPSAVVSPRLRVRGIHGLRVADASVMPVIPTGHTMAPAYMVGEKAADMIKQDWGFL